MKRCKEVNYIILYNEITFPFRMFLKFFGGQMPNGNPVQ